MAALQRRGFVRREGERFVPGPELARLAQPADAVASLVARAAPVMERLAAATGEAVTLGVALGHGAAYVAQRDGAHILKVGDWVGRSTTLHSTATGKVLLAFSDLRVDGRLERHTEKTIVDRVALRRELERTRLRGYGLTRNELELGLSAAAAPIFDPAGACIAALAVSGPSFRIARSLTSLGSQCVIAAGDITAALDTRRSRHATGTDNRRPQTSMAIGTPS
jgi:DNA-binding IclR family transcriptional regulator